MPMAMVMALTCGALYFLLLTWHYTNLFYGLLESWRNLRDFPESCHQYSSRLEPAITRDLESGKERPLQAGDNGELCNSSGQSSAKPLLPKPQAEAWMGGFLEYRELLSSSQASSRELLTWKLQVTISIPCSLTAGPRLFRVQLVVNVLLLGTHLRALYCEGDGSSDEAGSSGGGGCEDTSEEADGGIREALEGQWWWRWWWWQSN